SSPSVVFSEKGRLGGLRGQFLFCLKDFVRRSGPDLQAAMLLHVRPVIGMDPHTHWNALIPQSTGGFDAMVTIGRAYEVYAVMIVTELDCGRRNAGWVFPELVHQSLDVLFVMPLGRFDLVNVNVLWV